MRTQAASALDCAVNGVSLASLDRSIFVEDINEELKNTAETARRPVSGLRVLGYGRDTLVIKITVYIKPKGRYDPRADQYTAERYLALEKMLQWARTGYLTVSYRKNQRLYAYCTKPPSFSILTPDTRIQLEYTAYDDASWESTEYVTAAGTAVLESDTASLSLSITPKGTKDCYLEAEIICPIGMTYVRITAGGQFILLNRLVCEAETTILIGRDIHNRLTITSGSVSMLGYRTAESADDLFLAAGEENTVEITSDAACAVTIKARGLYM